MNDDLLNDFLLEAFPNPERKGCPDDETLKAFAEDRLPPGDPVLSHISSCSECYREYRHYRQDWKESSSEVPTATKLAPQSEPIPISVGDHHARVPEKRPFVRAWAVAAGLAIVLGAAALFFTQRHEFVAPSVSVASNATPVDADVNLFNAVTVRGGIGDEATPLEQVSLPSSMVHLTVTLPRFSQSGPYQLLVSRDRAGKNVVARGQGYAVEKDAKVRLAVTLDLRNTAAGAYFLATVRGSDNGTYYYPLKVN